MKYILFIGCLFYFMQLNAEWPDVERFPGKEYNEATEGLVYQTQEKEFVPEKSHTVTLDDLDEELTTLEQWLRNVFSDPFQILLFVLVGVFIVFLIIRISHFYNKRNIRQKKKLSLFDLKKLEENLPDIDLEEWLQKALKNNEFKAAMRILYLKVIKSLAQKQWIEWKKDKTNGDYALELFDTPHFKAYKMLTSIYERIWFGDIKISEKDFTLIAPKYHAFIEGLVEETLKMEHEI